MRCASVQVVLAAVAPALDIPMQTLEFLAESDCESARENFGARAGFSAYLQSDMPSTSDSGSDSAHRRSCLWASTKSPDGSRAEASKSDGAEARICIDLARLPTHLLRPTWITVWSIKAQISPPH
jgi:hypothetical protein